MIMRIQKPNNQAHQRGVALITALLILTIAATTAAYLTKQGHLNIRRSGNIINSNKAYLYALGAEKLAMIALSEDFKDDPKIDHPEESWAAPQVFDVEDSNGYVAGQISDLQSKLNLNNLLNEQNQKISNHSLNRIHQLYKTFEMDPAFGAAMFDWIDADPRDANGPGGAEHDYYLGLEQPYHAANRKIVSLTELRLIRGIGNHPNLLQFMKYVTALPERVMINVNSASPVLLTAIEGKSTPIRDAITDSHTQDATTADISFDNPEQEQQKPTRKIYKSVNEYMTQNGLKDGKNDFSAADLSVTTEYFLVEIEAKVDRGRTVLKSVIHRDKKGKMRVIMRTQGTL